MYPTLSRRSFHVYLGHLVKYPAALKTNPPVKQIRGRTGHDTRNQAFQQNKAWVHEKGHRQPEALNEGVPFNGRSLSQQMSECHLSSLGKALTATGDTVYVVSKLLACGLRAGLRAACVSFAYNPHCVYMIAFDSHAVSRCPADPHMLRFQAHLTA